MDSVLTIKRFIPFVIIIFSIILPGFRIGSCAYAQKTDKSQALNIGILPDTQGEGSSIAVHPMEAVLAKLNDLGTDIIIPAGDLTNHGTLSEFEQWTNIAKKYQESGIEFLPLMGNHETSHAYVVEWIDYMKEYIPDDAVHMKGAEYQNYYVIRKNVLVILLRYYNLPFAFQWIKDVVNTHAGTVDHILIASHDGLIGAKYGETREMIVEGVKGDGLLFNQWDEIRSFFARHDVIWIQGHEHMYQRSVISAPIHVHPASWTKTDRNYRLPQYTQIIAGNASYKGYEFRYGERDKVQAIIQQKMNTMKNGSKAFDSNASLLSFDGRRVDYQSYFTSHTIRNNGEGNKELDGAQWVMLDQFSRTSDRCERIVYPNSIPEGTRPALYHDILYRTNECYSEDGSVVKILEGINNTFNRVESTAEILSREVGFSRAESQRDLARLAYQYLFQYNEPWSPNLNGNERLILPGNARQVEIPATTTDLKEHVTLSWAPATAETLSDILIVSGTQIQSGTYQNAFGMEKDIETDAGLENSQPDGSAKQPHVLPETATKSWDVESGVSDRYVLQFRSKKLTPDRAIPAFYKDGEWIPFTSKKCLIRAAYNPGILDRLSDIRKKDCSEERIAGFDPALQNSWWVVLESDIELALVEK